MIFSADFSIKLPPKITQAWNFWNVCISETVDFRNLIILLCICHVMSLNFTGSDKMF